MKNAWWKHLTTKEHELFSQKRSIIIVWKVLKYAFATILSLWLPINLWNQDLNKDLWLENYWKFRGFNMYHFGITMKVIVQSIRKKYRGGSRTAATSKMECFVITTIRWKPLTVITKRSILDVAAVLDPSLKYLFRTFPSTQKNTLWAKHLVIF